MATGASQPWINAAEIGREAVLLARIFYGPGTNYTGAASGPVFSSRKPNGSPDYGQEFDGDQYPAIIVAPLPVSTNGNDIRTGKIQTGNAVLSLDGFSEIMADTAFGSGNDFGFENRFIEIVQWVPGITTWAACAPFKKGRMRAFSQKGTVVKITIQDQKAIANIKIPQDTLSAADAADGVSLPQDSVGKSKPIIIGDHRGYYGDTENVGLTTANLDNNFVGAIYKGIDEDSRHLWQISGHQMENMVTDETDSDKIWAKHESLGRMVQIVEFDVEQNNASGCIISLPNNPVYYDFVYGDGTNSNDQSFPAAPAGDRWDNAERANDKDLSTFTESVMGTEEEFPNEDEIDIDFSGYKKPGDATISEVRVFAKAFWNSGSGITEAQITFNINSRDIANPVVLAKNTIGVIHCDNQDSTEAGVNTNVKIEHRKFSSNSSHESTARVYQIWKRVTFTDSGEPLDVFPGCQGAEYSFGRAGHAEGTAAGILVKNAAGAAETIARDFLAITDIDEDGFDAASNLVDVDLAFGLTEQAPGYNTLAAIAYQSRSLIHPKANGDLSMTVIRKTYSASDFVVDFNALDKPTFKISKFEDIVTKALVNFRDSGGELINQTAIVEDSDMRDKYAVTAEQSFLQYPATVLENSASAVNLNNWLLDFWKQPHRFGKFGAGLEYTEMDIGDIIQFINVPRKQLGLDITIENTIAGQKIYQYFMIIDVTRTVNSAAFEVVQLHEVVY